MTKQFATSILCSSFILLGACGANNTNSKAPQSNSQSSSSVQQATRVEQTFNQEAVAKFDEPWALTTLPDDRLLITERQGKLKLFDPATRKSLEVAGVPKVSYGGQGGLGDVIVHPDYARNSWIYLSYAEAGTGGYGAVVIRAKLDQTRAAQPRLTDIQKIWTQVPKMSGQGHYAHRLAFDQEGKLWISSGERQKFDPAQDMTSNLGKIVRLNDDGTPATGNPFASQGGVTAQIWSLGHRNPLGMAFDAKGQLWVVEMGPKGGDELNRIVKGANYGYPIVSNGNHYSGKPIPDHDTRPEFQAPEVSWTPVISPSSMIIYQHTAFPAWKDKAIIGGLSSESIVVVDLQSQPVQEVQRIDMQHRIRGVHAAKDGSLWVIQDGANASLLKLTPKSSTDRL